MEKLRALWIPTTKFNQNGIAAAVRNCFSVMDFSACTVDFVTLNELPPDLKEAVRAEGGACFVLPMRNRRPLSYLHALTKLIRAGRYDIVHAHGNSCTLAAELLAARRGGARVRIAHSHNTSCTHRAAHLLLRPCMEKNVTCRLACGQDAGKWLFRDQPFTVLPNAIDTGRFAFSTEQRLRIRAALGWQDAFVVGHTGLFTPRKNHMFLAESFLALSRRDPSARLLLVGDGPTRPAVSALFADAGISDRVHFTGETDGAAPLYSAMDAFALPSLSEGLPFTLIEAQCAGLPCLASDAVTRESDLTGLVRFLPLTAAQWADALAGIQAPDREAGSRRAVARIAEAGYDLRQNGAALLNLYRAEAGR